MNPVFSKCPTCGSRKIKLIEGDYVLTEGTSRIVIPDLLRYECPECGEVLLDYEAMKQIETHRFGGPSRATA